MRKIKFLKNKLNITLIYFCCLAVFWFLKFPCVFNYIFGIPCPGCGMSHAFLSALRFDFIEAFSYHSMFWSMPILYLYFLFDGKLFNKKSLDLSILILIGVGFLINWIANLW